MVLVMVDPYETPQADPKTHLSLEDLTHGLAALAAAARDSGRVALLVRRGATDERATPGMISVSPEQGVSEDRWDREREAGERSYGADYADMQIAVMELPVAELIANGQPLTLFGDNLFIDLDLSDANLPSGSRLGLGTASFEVTPFPHNGCAKFHARFGADALRFVSEKPRRPRNLRGIYLRCVEAGEIRLGDKATVISRPSSSP